MQICTLTSNQRSKNLHLFLLKKLITELIKIKLARFLLWVSTFICYFMTHPVGLDPDPLRPPLSMVSLVRTPYMLTAVDWPTMNLEWQFIPHLNQLK